MAKKALIFQNFEGGWSTDLRVGIKHSQYYTQSLDFRKSPSQMSVLPATAREDANVVKDLILNEVQTSDGTIFATGNAGYVYKRTTAGAWSAFTQLSSGAGGIDYRQDADAIYLTGTSTASLIRNVSTGGVIQPDYYATSLATYDNSTNVGYDVASYQVNSTQIYTLPTTVGTSGLPQFGDVDHRFFQSDIEPIYSISVYCVTKGTGNWTLTLYDPQGTSLGSATVATANISSSSWVEFTFSSPIRIYVSPNARTYNFTLTSTVADGTVSTSQRQDLSHADVQIKINRFVNSTNGFHPVQRFLQYECFGNGNYLSVWEPLSDPPTNDEWIRHRLTFPREFEVCGLAVLNEYLAIACERTNSSSGPTDGVIFWWDGLSPTYNYLTRTPEGAPYGIREYKNVVYYYAGNAYYAIAGANSVPTKVRTMPGADTEFSGANVITKVYPYSATTRRGIHLLGYPSTTTSTGINFGVYSWGAVDKNYPQSFGYNYIMSTGSKNYSASNNLSIGMVKNFNDTLHISWRDDLNGGYGIDVVNNSSTPAATSQWQSLTIDDGYVSKQKTANYMELYYSMPTNSSITMSYQIDQSGTWTTSDSYSSTSLWQGQTNYARFQIDDVDTYGGRFREIQLRFDITSTATTPPVVSMVGFVYDDDKEEVVQ